MNDDAYVKARYRELLQQSVSGGKKHKKHKTYKKRKGRGMDEDDESYAGGKRGPGRPRKVGRPKKSKSKSRGSGVLVGGKKSKKRRTHKKRGGAMDSEQVTEAIKKINNPLEYKNMNYLISQRTKRETKPLEETYFDILEDLELRSKNIDYEVNKILEDTYRKAQEQKFLLDKEKRDLAQQVAIAKKGQQQSFDNALSLLKQAMTNVSTKEENLKKYYVDTPFDSKVLGYTRMGEPIYGTYSDVEPHGLERGESAEAYKKASAARRGFFF